MADDGAESMFGGTMFHREMIQREISRALVLNLSGKPSGASALPGIFLSLTEPSLLSRRTLFPLCRRSTVQVILAQMVATRLRVFRHEILTFAHH